MTLLLLFILWQLAAGGDAEEVVEEKGKRKKKWTLVEVRTCSAEMLMLKWRRPLNKKIILVNFVSLAY
jgi:hypothetical protein